MQKPFTPADEPEPVVMIQYRDGFVSMPGGRPMRPEDFLELVKYENGEPSRVQLVTVDAPSGAARFPTW